MANFKYVKNHVKLQFYTLYIDLFLLLFKASSKKQYTIL